MLSPAFTTDQAPHKYKMVVCFLELSGGIENHHMPLTKGSSFLITTIPIEIDITPHIERNSERGI